MTDIAINQTFLEETIETLATYSDAEAPAVTRVLFTPTELEARAFIRTLMENEGLAVREDAVGNIFGRWQGSEPDRPPIATGSHIDAIPFSGRFDGTVGVLGALEAMRALREGGFTPRRSIDLIMFTAEEPTRFGIGCLGSRALAGNLSPEDLVDLKDSDNQPFDMVRQAAGYDEPLDSVLLPKEAYAGFVELHIEQGTRLEESGNSIGIVTAIAAPATLRVVLYGDGGHAGTVLMPQRHDALAAAAELVLAVERAAQESDSADAVATVGLCHVYPNAVNSIPSRVLMEIDIRDIDLASRDAMVETIKHAVAEICAKRSLKAHVSVLNANKPSRSGDVIVETLEQVAQEQGYGYQKLVSRAYHDALFMAEICPTAMIFVPSQHGYSHRPEEFTAIEDIVRGVDVLAHTLARLSSA